MVSVVAVTVIFGVLITGIIKLSKMEIKDKIKNTD